MICLAFLHCTWNVYYHGKGTHFESFKTMNYFYIHRMVYFYICLKFRTKKIKRFKNSPFCVSMEKVPSFLLTNQGFQSGPVPGTFTRLRSCIVPAEITEPPKISGGENHKYDGR